MVSYIVSRIPICLKILLMLLAFGAAKPFQNSVSAKVPTAKIIDGRDVVKRNISHPHPYLVSIQYKTYNNEYRHTCGGAILDRWTIITAAHCFDDDYQPHCWGKDPSCYRVVAGMYDLCAEPDPTREQTSEFPSDAIDDHENFDGFHFDNDIALIHLPIPLNFSSHVKPIRLVNPDRQYWKSDATIAGWGQSNSEVKTCDKAENLTPFLQEARVNIYSDEKCIHQWGDDYHSENMICASGDGGGFTDASDNAVSHAGDTVSDACQGDSGGPLVAKDMNRKRRYLVGLISWGYECGIKEYPGLYTRVEAYLPWIKERRHHMKQRRQQRSSCAPTP